MSFETARSRLVGAYEKAGRPYVGSTVPYLSTRGLMFEIVDTDLVNNLGFAIARKDQSLEFFSYGLGDKFDLVNGITKKANSADTNLAKGGSTNGVGDMVIESVGIGPKGLRMGIDNAAANYGVLDVDVASALAGATMTGAIYDPGALCSAPQSQSPFNLEDGLYNAASPHMAVKLTFDSDSFRTLTTADMMPSGSARSALRAAGVPEARNTWKIPEGILWRRDGQGHSELAMIVELKHDIVVPISLPWNAAHTARIAPTVIVVEIAARISGLELTEPRAA